jgi:hypothetical protein
VNLSVSGELLLDQLYCSYDPVSQTIEVGDLNSPFT